MLNKAFSTFTVYACTRFFIHFDITEFSDCFWRIMFMYAKFITIARVKRLKIHYWNVQLFYMFLRLINIVITMFPTYSIDCIQIVINQKWIRFHFIHLFVQYLLWIDFECSQIIGYMHHILIRSMLLLDWTCVFCNIQSHGRRDEKHFQFFIQNICMFICVYE